MDQTEFIAAMHAVNALVDDMCTTVESILSENKTPTVEVPVEALMSVVSTLRMQSSITRKLVEQNAEMFDLVEKVTRDL